ncbi:MAG: hypothetical protein NC900_03070 [Candidatus Omnitrophica bacterium]|nr:hypothetical protein [Candidatus Omnitrophota bacterium]MCM8799700.1 hypothetical protein [Candidatus Omnitrophota bacterium]
MNRKATAFILCYTIVFVLTVLSSGYFISSVAEKNFSQRYLDSRKAFWIAEAALAKSYYNWKNNPNYTGEEGTFAGGNYTIDKETFSPEVIVNASFGTASKTIKANFVRIPHPFENTISCGRNMSLSGLLARIEVYDKTRISGNYNYTWGAKGWFQDKLEGVNPDYTTIKIPDYDQNGISDEFNDFVYFARNVINSYPSQEVVYIKTNNTVNIFPNHNLIGKKVIFVEGSLPGEGDVNIFFDGTWQESEDLTVISTGDISYIEPLQFQANARLSTISWEDYNEASIFRSQHQSVIYAHQDANFVDILDWGSTTGNVIVNNNIWLEEVLTYEKYYYSDRAFKGDLPAGFAYLSGNRGKTSIVCWRQL